MKLQKQGWTFMAAVALVVGFASTALAIEAFPGRFGWGDLGTPSTLRGRVIILDPYDEAVWLNIAVFGGNAESGLFWQRIHPGKNLKFYPADKNVWEQLKSMARPHSGPAAAKEVPPGSPTTLVEFVAQEVEQNRRVISSVKKLADNAGEMGKPKSISSLRLKECEGKTEVDAPCHAAKTLLNTSPKTPDGANLPLQYDVLLPNGKPLANLIPWTAKYNQGGGHH